MGIQLYKAGVGPASGPTWRPSHFGATEAVVAEAEVAVEAVALVVDEPGVEDLQLDGGVA